MQLGAAQLGLQDDPILQDPAGLYDSFSVNGGNLLSARDLAIIARAVLAQPLLAQVVSTPVYDFVGPDGVHHRLGNHNLMLKTYPGAIGMKTGYTSKAGEDLIAAARRNGRTLIAVVLGAPNLWQDAGGLLDEGFAMAPGAVGTGDRLPPVRLPGQSLPSTAHVAAAAIPVQATVIAVPRSRSRVGEEAAVALGLAAAAAVGVRRRQITVRRRRRQRLAARQEMAAQWGSLR
jgi:D-alanyl-D-alanine carboxypeptidase (penicillin-binding protein 5/6)